MVRVASPFGYQDPTAEIGRSLGRALFGDPQMAAQQAEQQAQADQRRAAAEADRAHARLYGAQADGQTGQNTASSGLPELMASFAPMPGETQDTAFRRALPSVIARIGQAQGDKIDIPKTIGPLAAFLGGDEMARRGLIAQGNSPTAAFALTPERADAIAAQDDRAKIEQALGVAQINNRDDIPVAQIKAGADVNVAGINHASDIPVANIRAADSRSAARDARQLRFITPNGHKALDEEFYGRLGAKWNKETRTWVGGKRFVPEVMTRLRSRAVDFFQQSGNPVAAVSKAWDEPLAAGKANLARRAASAANTSGAARRLTITQAEKLPSGARFIGTDGVERIRK